MSAWLVLKMTITAGQLRRFRPLLWRGFSLEVEVGGSIEDLLINELGIDREFVESKIQTVFLNGCPVDDLACAIVEEGSQIALAGAAPGMVGIAMRRHSPAGFIRQGITHPRAKTSAKQKKGRITVKLFNEMAEVLGPIFLRRGIGVEARALNEFCDDASGALAVEMDGKAATLEDIKRRLSKDEDPAAGFVLLKVHACT